MENTLNQPWVNISKLALYAPAHHGVEVISLAMQALPGLASLLGLFAKFKFPILNDLDAKDQGILPRPGWSFMRWGIKFIAVP